MITEVILIIREGSQRGPSPGQANRIDGQIPHLLFGVLVGTPNMRSTHGW